MGWLPEHFVAPGLQSVQLPATQATVHGVPFWKVPLASQVSGVLPLHCCDPGLHIPVQLPAEQMKGQGIPLLALVQWPPESQI